LTSKLEQLIRRKDCFTWNY